MLNRRNPPGAEGKASSDIVKKLCLAEIHGDSGRSDSELQGLNRHQAEGVVGSQKVLGLHAVGCVTTPSFGDPRLLINTPSHISLNPYSGPDDCLALWLVRDATNGFDHLGFASEAVYQPADR
jgi:hypothetical protein